MPRLLVLLGLTLLASPLRADEATRSASAATPAPSIEKLVERLKPSVVVVTVTGRDGKRHGLGTGFVVGSPGDGLIATNLHVIGEARPISVETSDGKTLGVAAVHASDRVLDLALLHLAGSETDLKALVPLDLAPAATLKQGQPVVALGNPVGLTYSVVSGVVSGTREIDGRTMIQLAIPIEPGNSGGPLVDLDGKVHGIITMKSLVTPNLGFAVPVAALQALLKKPNPIPMSRWLTIGTLDPHDWQLLMGANWRQRGGRISVDGAGSGFGGRSLCLARTLPPALPFEVAVTVRLDDERGAAGLVFHADGGDKHYGFYPSGGELRLTRFNGPDVLSWTILAQPPSTYYLPGDWNTLKVRVEKGALKCFVNDHLVIESTDAEFAGGSVGLAKFRETKAEFKGFQVAATIPPAGLSTERLAKDSSLLDALPKSGAVERTQVDQLTPDPIAGITLLRERAKQLEAQAARLRSLAADVHERRVLNELAQLLEKPEAELDLLAAALQLARLDNEDLDPEPYRKEVDRIAREVAATLSKSETGDLAKLDALNTYLFKERGFHGSRSDYYNRSNSYLNEVIDDREGLPITLSVLYLEIARRIGVTVVGVGLPGHFMVRYEPAPGVKGKARLIDVYEGGERLSRTEAEQKVFSLTGRRVTAAHLATVDKKAILVRMLTNLLGNARGEDDAKAAVRYLDAILTITPAAPEEHWLRAVYCYQTGRKQAALADVDWLLEKRPEGVDLERVEQLRQVLTRAER